VPEGYVAWLIETRANLELTEAGRRIATLAETSEFDVHPTAAEAALVG
jgi:homogentisate 1,2-dioxygenase